MEIEIGCGIFPEGMKIGKNIVPDNARTFFNGMDRQSCDYIDLLGGTMYTVQRIVIGNQFVSQVEKKI